LAPAHERLPVRQGAANKRRPRVNRAEPVDRYDASVAQ
jgi:hypothetical protein